MKTEIIEFIKDFGYILAVIVMWPATKFLAGRVIKSYESQIETIIKDVAELKIEIKTMKSTYLPIQEAEKLVQDVRDERERYFKETSRQHTQLREDFKNLTGRIDGLYDLLVERKH